MKIRYSHELLGFFILVAILTSCKKKDNVEPELSVTPIAITFPAEGGALDLSISCNAQWDISNPVSSWLQLSSTSGNSGSATIHLTTGPNGTGSTRSGILVINSSNGQSRRVTVSQPPTIFPSYNITPKAPDATGMNSTSAQLIAKIRLGVNIGNTLELNGVEPYPTASYISFLKQSGFNAVRIPCGWYLHGGNNATAKIPQSWLDSVKQVVQWCVNNDMYVLLNIHWDGGWLENNVTVIKKDSVNARQKAYWEQIATTMRDIDEHLMFASANEPGCNDNTTAAVLTSYHQTFIDAVRSTGGRNAYRTVVIQGNSDFTYPGKYFPSDPASNRLAFEWHNYTPSNFTILNDDPPVGWGDIFFYWGAGNHTTIEPKRNSTYGEEAEQLQSFNTIKTKYIDKGIPCIMGEYSANRRNASSWYVPAELDKHNNSVDAWYTYLTKQCLTIGAKPFFWETGGVFDRQNNVILDQRTVNAVIAGSQ